MVRFKSLIVAIPLLVILIPSTVAYSQVDSLEDRPKVLPRTKLTPEQKNQAEALTLFGKAAVLERDNQLIEAMKTYEAALKLDPDRPAILRGLIPLYLAVDRSDDAFVACERVLKLVPDDFATASLYARHLRIHDRPAEALAVLTKMTRLPELKSFPELQARMSYDRAQLHEDRKEWAEAIKAYRETAAILDEPEELLEMDRFSPEEIARMAAETYEHLGRIYLKQDETKEASKAFEEARKREPARAPRLAFILAEVMSNKGDWVNALARVDEYLTSEPQGLEGYELKIKALRKLNRPGEILPALEQASRRDHYNIGLKLLLAKELRLADKKDDAERTCLDLAKERPTAEVFRELFTIYHEEGPSGGAKALNMLNEVIDKSAPRNDKSGDPAAGVQARAMLAALREDGALVRMILKAFPVRLQSGPALATPTTMMFASLALRLRQLDLAEQMYRACLDQKDRTESEVYGNLLRALAWAHKNEAVIELCQRGLKEGAKSNRAMFHLEMSQALLNLDRTKEALAEGKEAVLDAGEAEDLLSRRNYVYLLSQMEKHAEAIAECQSMLKEYNQPGEQRDIRSTLSIVYQNAGEAALSEEQLQKILDTDPGDATTCNDLGYQWADRNKNLDEAERLIRKALELDRKQRREGNWLGLEVDLDNAPYLDSLGWVLFRKGQLDEAKRELERASQLPTGADDPTVWSHLGDVYKAMGNSAAARTAWQKALGHYDNHQRRPDSTYRELKQKLRDAEK